MTQAQLFMIWLAMQTASGTKHEVQDSQGEIWGDIHVIQGDATTTPALATHHVTFSDGTAVMVHAARCQ